MYSRKSFISPMVLGRMRTSPNSVEMFQQLDSSSSGGGVQSFAQSCWPTRRAVSLLLLPTYLIEAFPPKVQVDLYGGTRDKKELKVRARNAARDLALVIPGLSQDPWSYIRDFSPPGTPPDVRESRISATLFFLCRTDSSSARYRRTHPYYEVNDNARCWLTSATEHLHPHLVRGLPLMCSSSGGKTHPTDLYFRKACH